MPLVTITFYNRVRLHSGINDLSPIEYEQCVLKANDSVHFIGGRSLSSHRPVYIH